MQTPKAYTMTDPWKPSVRADHDIVVRIAYFDKTAPFVAS